MAINEPLKNDNLKTRTAMRIFFLTLSLLASILLAAPQPAQARACYNPAEAEAEQGIRIHSELMVIGLNCQHMGAREGMNLYSTYRQFTADNADLFATYEQILLRYFQDNGVKKPEAELNRLRTDFANKISKDVADMRPDVFCARYAPRITRASAMNKDEIRRWSATVYKSHPVSHPVCGG